MNISKITNASVYLDGTNDMIGRAAEITLPKVAAKQDEHKPLGLIGTIKLPGGLEAMEMSIKWDSFFADALKHRLNPYRVTQLQVRADLETYGPGGREDETPVVLIARVTWSEAALGAIKGGEKMDGQDDTVQVSYLKLAVDGDEQLEVDIWNNIWRVNGEDLLAAYRTNIGG